MVKMFDCQHFICKLNGYVESNISICSVQANPFTFAMILIYVYYFVGFPIRDSFGSIRNALRLSSGLAEQIINHVNIILPQLPQLNRFPFTLPLSETSQARPLHTPTPLSSVLGLDFEWKQKYIRIPQE